ncbi:MAG: hypothetical protein H7232_17290 [Aeromicrobium sp.]|nr:hypothetical protein [Burkholderiales bacterium]
MKLVLTRWATATAFAAAALTALAQEPPIPGQKSFKEVELIIAKSIYKVMPTKGPPGDYVLMPQRISKDDKPPAIPKYFVFMKADLGSEAITCEQGEIMRLFWTGNTLSAISVGVCHEQRNKLIGILNQGPKAVSAITAQLLDPKQGFTIDKAGFVKAGFYYNKRTLPDGSELHYYPLFYLQNDGLVVESVVLLDKQGAWIVQSQLGHFCAKASAQLHQQRNICTDTETVLGEIAQEVRAKFPVGKPPASQAVPVRSAPSPSGIATTTEKK